MTYQTLDFEFSKGIATITLNRKDNSANALNAQMTDELFDVSVRCGSSEVRSVVITGAGKMFCGGGDLVEMDAIEDKHSHLTKMATLLHAGLTRFSHI
ncbi:MAG: enoyl-CoA hydratase, partial [Rhodobacteraceae bacterium]|nr:enoyl-CoA hydratase [Paracoccaceae bacterium]